MEKVDYCFFCGKTVEQDGWRDHMIGHNVVLENSPLRNGTWLDHNDVKVAAKKAAIGTRRGE